MGKNARSSNFELLRILAMFMIVLYHCLTECMMADPSNRWVLSMYYLSHWGVPVFILLSGYFTIKLSVKCFVDFWLYCAIWMLLSYLFSFAVGNGEWHVVSLLQYDFFYGIVGMIIENYSGITQIPIVILYAAVLSMLVVVVDKLIREPLSKQVDRIIK